MKICRHSNAMITDVHTRVFRPETDFDPRLLADLKRCGVEPESRENVSERPLQATRAANVAIVFGIQAVRTG